MRVSGLGAAIGPRLRNDVYLAVRRKLVRESGPGGDLDPRLRPVFIVGPPRCGSTIVFQTITNDFRVLYPDNLVAKWYGDLRVGIGKSRMQFGDAPHASTTSVHGDTTAAGLHAPSEIAPLWYRWLPRGHHYAAKNDVTARATRELRQEVIGTSVTYGMPWVFKNLANSERLGWLHAVLPEARVLVVRRNVDEVVSSIITARRSVGVPSHAWWSIKPKDWEAIPTDNEAELVRHQVDAICSDINVGLRQFEEADIAVVDYADFRVGIEEAAARWEWPRRNPRLEGVGDAG